MKRKHLRNTAKSLNPTFFFETWAWKTPSTELLQLNLYGDIEIPYIFGWWSHLVFVRSESFEVYGFDFLIGEDLKPWLLGKLDSTIHGRNITWCVFFACLLCFFHWWLGRCYEQNGRLDRLVSNYWNPQFSGFFRSLTCFFLSPSFLAKNVGKQRDARVQCWGPVSPTLVQMVHFPILTNLGPKTSLKTSHPDVGTTCGEKKHLKDFTFTIAIHGK